MRELKKATDELRARADEHVQQLRPIVWFDPDGSRYEAELIPDVGLWSVQRDVSQRTSLSLAWVREMLSRADVICVEVQYAYRAPAREPATPPTTRAASAPTSRKRWWQFL